MMFLIVVALIRIVVMLLDRLRHIEADLDGGDDGQMRDVYHPSEYNLR